MSESKAKIKSRAYLQLGAKTLQIVHQTFDSDIPVILHLPALTTTMDTDTIPMLFVIQEGRHCMPTTDYYFMNIQPDPITIPPPPQRKQLGPDSSTHSNQGSNSTTNVSTEAMAENNPKEKKIPTDYISDSDSSEEETNQYLRTSQEERLYHTVKGSAQATQAALAHATAQCNPTVERGPAQQLEIKTFSTGQASEKPTQMKGKDESH